MTQSNFKNATLARYFGKAIVFGTMVSDTVRWARWASSDSWFKVSIQDVVEF